MILRILLILMLMCSTCYGAIDFTGDADRIEITYDAATLGFSSTDNIAFGAWVYPDSTIANGDAIISQGTEIVLRWATGAKAECILNSFSTNDRVSSLSNTVPTQTWTHVMCYYNGSTIAVYIDGSLSNQVTPTGTYGGVSTNFFVSSINGTNSFWDGKIDEPFIYQTPTLSQSEIDLLALSKVKRIPLQVETANLSMYLPLDDLPDGSTSMNTTIFVDLSGNDNTGDGKDGDTDSVAKASEVLSYP